MDQAPVDPALEELVKRVDRASAERDWPPEARRRLVEGGLRSDLGSAGRTGAGAGMVSMDTAVAAVSGVVAAMIEWERDDEVRHHRRLAAAAAGPSATPPDQLPTRRLLRALAAKARQRAFRRTTG
jgi:hypothetical protein